MAGGSGSLAASTLGWWADAGVDVFVEEAPRDWLAPVPVAPSVVPPEPASPEVAVPAAEAMAPAAALPGDLAAFRAWLRADPSLPGPAAARLDAAGDPATGTMVVVDMPEPEDGAAGTLLGGEAGALFDNMMRAIGLARETLYLAPLASARPASGRLDAGAIEAFGRLMRHHVALARPRRLLLMGDAAVRAMLAMPCAAARGRVHPLDADGHAVAAVASFHPRFLVQTPARKAAAWADLKLFKDL